MYSICMMSKKTYEIESEKIIEKMLRVLYRAQRKVDDKNYRETLKKLENLENGGN